MSGRVECDAHLRLVARPKAALDDQTSAPAETPTATAQSFERRTVVVPEQEQLKPESIVRGMIEDIVKERPWLPWVVAFLIGWVLGRAAGRRE